MLTSILKNEYILKALDEYVLSVKYMYNKHIQHLITFVLKPQIKSRFVYIMISERFDQVIRNQRKFNNKMKFYPITDVFLSVFSINYINII